MNLPKRPRPISITILAIIFLWLAIWNGLRLGEAIFFWRTLEAYDTSPLYISLNGGIWFIIGLLITFSLWQGRGWGRVAVICTSIGYTAWYWFDRLVLQEPRANWPFVLVVNIIFLLLIFFIIFSRGTRSYYKKDFYGR
jgi:hypothetical protein